MAAVVHQPPPVQFQPALMPSSGQVPAQDPEMRRQKYKNVLYGLGITELVMGIIFMLLGFINLGIAANGYGYSPLYGLALISPGIWCSAPLIASGAVGIHTKKNSSACFYNANMAMSIVSAIMMGILFIFSVITAFSGHVGIVVVQSLLAIGSFSAMVVNIVHSAYCCAGICCMRNYYPGQVVYIPAPQSNQQYVQLANGQYMMVQAAPHPTGYSLQNMGASPLQAPYQSSLQNVGASPLQAPYQPMTYVHPAPQGPNQPMTYPVSQQSNGNEYHAVGQQEQVSTNPPGSLLPKFPETFND